MGVRVLVLHGPNLNLLGLREPQIYGSTTLAQLDADLVALGEQLGLEVETAQANGEGQLIDRIQAFATAAIPAAHGQGTSVDPPTRALVFNPGGYTHSSVALRDAIAGLELPTIEVHISNLYGRESFRHTSVTGGACRGVIMGLGTDSYRLALRAVKRMFSDEPA